VTIKSDQHGFEVQASRPALSQTLAVGAGSIQSAAFQTYPTMGAYAATGVPITSPNNTLHIRLASTADCWVSFGTNPTAVVAGVASILLPAGVPEYFWVYPGEKVAVIQNAAGGSLNVAEMVA
jgi:hypothetical protein